MSWWKQNPFPFGVNWTSGIEVGIRLISFVWIRRLLDGWYGAPALFEENDLAVAQIRWHQEYLSRVPQQGLLGQQPCDRRSRRSAGGELAPFPGFPRVRSGAVKRAVLLERELELNTFPSGLNREQASDYHGFVAELGILGRRRGRACGHPLDQDAGRGCRGWPTRVQRSRTSRSRPAPGRRRRGSGLSSSTTRTRSLVDSSRDIGALVGAPTGGHDESLRCHEHALVHWHRVVRRWTTTASEAPLSFFGCGHNPDADDVSATDPRSGAGVTAGHTAFLSIAAHARTDSALYGSPCTAGSRSWSTPAPTATTASPRSGVTSVPRSAHNTIELGRPRPVGLGRALHVAPARPHQRDRRLATARTAMSCVGPPSMTATRSLDLPATTTGRTVHWTNERRIETLRRDHKCGAPRARMAFHLGPRVSCSLDGTAPGSAGRRGRPRAG